jgi:hypothetical protein
MAKDTKFSRHPDSYREGSQSVSSRDPKLESSSRLEHLDWQFE